MDHPAMSDSAATPALPGTIAFIKYGKANVSFYRTYARPLTGLTPIPESAFVGRENTLFAYDVEVQVLDQTLAPAYTVGDNSQVVATDTMKNFIHQVAVEFEGATLEEYLLFLGRRFFETWDHVTSLRLLGRELPFPAVTVPVAGGFGPSDVLFGEARGDYGSARLEVVRESNAARITSHQAGRQGLHLIKLTGSSFADFVRDQYTTLPSVKDRPLYIYLDAFWKYADAADAVSPDHARYVAAEQVRDLIATVFHEFVSMSIQHLMHEMGQRILARFPQLAEVSFDGQNRLWDTVVVSEIDRKIKSYCDPRPPFGSLHLTLTRA
jgi:urate oxidase / 2-oxo-4-hydroxy-4-carboxy-5-ureidoimidazoline decarboxylase